MCWCSSALAYLFFSLLTWLQPWYCRTHAVFIIGTYPYYELCLAVASIIHYSNIHYKFIIKIFCVQHLLGSANQVIAGPPVQIPKTGETISIKLVSARKKGSVRIRKRTKYAKRAKFAKAVSNCFYLCYNWYKRFWTIDALFSRYTLALFCLG